MTVCIISLILAGMAASVASSGFYARMHVLDVESAARARTFARGCTDHALLVLIADPSYHGDATTTHDTLSCYIFPIIRDDRSSRVTIMAQARALDAYINVIRVVDMRDLHTTPMPPTPIVGTIEITDVSYREVLTLP